MVADMTQWNSSSVGDVKLQLQVRHSSSRSRTTNRHIDMTCITPTTWPVGGSSVQVFSCWQWSWLWGPQNCTSEISSPFLTRPQTLAKSHRECFTSSLRSCSTQWWLLTGVPVTSHACVHEQGLLHAQNYIAARWSRFKNVKIRYRMY